MFAFVTGCHGVNLYSRSLLLHSRCISTTAIRLENAASSSVEKKTVPKEGDVKPEFYVPKAERESDRDAFLLEKLITDRRLERGDRLCPTRELNFTADTWGAHKSPFRKFRHMANTFQSSSFQRLFFPDLTGVAFVASALTYYNEFIVEHVDLVATVSSKGMAGATTAIGLLAGFRLNASYGRYQECRIFWGDINNTIRDLTCESLMWMKDQDQKKRMFKLCKAFPMVLIFHLHTKGCHHSMYPDSQDEVSFEDRVHAEFLAELRDIYSDELNDDFERLSCVKYTGGNAPLDVITMMRETISASVDIVDSMYVRELDEQCQRLCAALGASERLLRTPLPTAFTRHSSRLLFIWSLTLPFALYPAMGPWGTLPASLLTAFAVLGIEDIGVQLEEPFDILPLRQYSDGMFKDIDQMEKGFSPYAVTRSCVQPGHDPSAAVRPTYQQFILSNRKQHQQI